MTTAQLFDEVETELRRRTGQGRVVMFDRRYQVRTT